MADPEVAYLTFEDALAIHEEIMERTGHAPAPLRSEDLLQSALARPQHAAYYEGVDLVIQATLLMLGISANQPFLDGNKRTGMACGLLFLEMNGLTFDGDDELLAVLIEEAASQEQSAAAATIVGWLSGQISPTSP